MLLIIFPQMDECEIAQALKSITATRQATEHGGRQALAAYGDLSEWQTFMDHTTATVALIQARKSILLQQTWKQFVAEVRGE